MGVRWTVSLNLRAKVSTSEEPPTLVSLEVSSQLRSEQECPGMSLGARDCPCGPGNKVGSKTSSVLRHNSVLFLCQLSVTVTQRMSEIVILTWGRGYFGLWF